MLKAELEDALAKYEAEDKRKKAEITKICRKAIEDNCDEAIEPVTAVAKILGLDLKIDGYCELYLEVPIQILEKINDGEIKAEDIKMTIKGEEVNVTCINDLSAGDD